MKNILILLSLLLPISSHAADLDHKDIFALHLCGEYIADAKIAGITPKGTYFKQCQKMVDGFLKERLFTERVRAYMAKNPKAVHVVSTPRGADVKFQLENIDSLYLTCDVESGGEAARCVSTFNSPISDHHRGLGKVNFVVSLVVAGKNSYATFSDFSGLYLPMD